MTYPVRLERKEQSLQRSIYSGMRLAQKIKHWIAADKKRVFDIEADSKLWDKDIKTKAKAAGVSVEEYESTLKSFMSRPLIRLAITIMRCENDFLENWWVNIKKAEELALANNDVKEILMVEREKMMGIKRLVETGRMINPEEYTKAKAEEKEVRA